MTEDEIECDREVASGAVRWKSLMTKSMDPPSVARPSYR
jgi:hypothetical protein